MLESIADLPPNVVGFRAVGEVTATDYQQVLLPALQKAHQGHHKIRFLFQFGPEFSSYTGGAMLEDAVTGILHFTHFERIAVVSDFDWITNAVNMLGFAVPGSIRVFPGDAVEDAITWLNHSELKHEFLPDEGILLVTPHGELCAGDFEELAREVDPYLENHDNLQGIVLDGTGFSGWESFGAFVAHLRFVKEHHTKVARVAIVSDRALFRAMQKIAAHFVAAELKHFPAAAKREAVDWVRA